MQHHFSWLFLQTIEASIMTNNNTLISGIFGDQFNLDMMVPQRSNEAPKTPEGLTVLFPVTIPETKNNKEFKGSMDSTVELNKMVICQRQIPGHLRGAGNTPYKIIGEGMKLETYREEKETRRK